ncbi:MAG: hypothetical protein K6G12_00455 [Lachnospiraceae bacterium]|nr:hypothetical protein [Lachnospiraceae bacterium]
MRSLKVLYALFVLVLTVMVTYMGMYFGKELYEENVTEGCSRIVDAEVIDFVENIRYGLELGKDMKSFYEMDEDLSELVKDCDSFQAAYIIDPDYRTVYGTDEEVLPEDLKMLKKGMLVFDGMAYSKHEINEEYTLVTASDMSIIEEITRDDNYLTPRLANIGCAVVMIITLSLLIFIKDERRMWRDVMIVIGGWGCVLGIIGCALNYNSYQKRVGLIEHSINTSIMKDIDKISSYGVSFDDVGDIDEYLSRYYENTDCIERITYIENSEELSFVSSTPSMSSIVFKYILQVLIEAAFLFIILWEMRIFMDEVVSDIYIRSQYKENSKKEDAGKETLKPEGLHLYR